MKTWTPNPPKPSPVGNSGLVGWLRENLFSTPGNTILTLIGLVLLLIAVPPVLDWALLDASWFGENRKVCDAAMAAGKDGACWVFINVRMDVFMYGFYPIVEHWRVNFVMLVLAFLLLPILLPDLLRTRLRTLVFYAVGAIATAGLFGFVPLLIFAVFAGMPYGMAAIEERRLFPFTSNSGSVALPLRLALSVLLGGAGTYGADMLGGADLSSYIGWVVAALTLVALQLRSMNVVAWRWLMLFTAFPVFVAIMLLGGAFGLPHVETHYWGGLFLTLVVAGTGMGTALPIGILLALGRRSNLPVIRTICIAFIEFARGVPLVSVLFMASVMFPLFLPENVTFDKLLRALIGVSFFYAAYMAEVVRGGLQALPSGQYEAAQALGWPYWRMMTQIILPQTLRLVIPGLANNFLSLLKDTTLVAVIGLFDLLGIAKAAMADAEWLGFTKESYIFAAVVFWIFCFAISRYCLYLEKKYHTSYH